MASIGQESIGLRSVLASTLAENWWLILLRGIAAILFGVLAFIWPGITLFTLIIFFGAYALVDGVFSIMAAIRGGTMAPRWWLALVGVAGLATAAITFFWPGKTAFILVLFIGWWSIVKGIFEIVGAISLRKEIDNEWMLVFAGALSVAFGAVIVLFPGAGALALIWMIAVYAIIFGVVLVGLAFRLKARKAA
jgi:uncharacterized membrane protein HdeD (DUF308 family)